MACRLQTNADNVPIGMNSSNGETSILFDKFKSLYGVDTAQGIYAQLRTKEFTDWFGMNWETAASIGSPFTDANGEPILRASDGKFEIMNTEGEFKSLEDIMFSAKARLEGQGLEISAAQTLVDPKLEAELADTAITILQDIRMGNSEYFKDPARTDAFFSVEEGKDGKIDKGPLAKIMLAESFKGLGRSPADLNTAVELFDIWKENREDFNKLQEALPDGVTLDPVAKAFFRVYDQWLDVPDPVTGDSLRVGWRSKVRDRLANHGLTLRDDLGEMVEMDDTPVRIHNLSRLEENPRNKLSAVTKAALAGIKAPKSNRLGRLTNLPIDAVYGEIAESTVDSRSFREMMAKLKIKAKYKPEMQPVIDRLKQLEAREQGAVFTNFALAYKNFLQFTIAQEVTINENGETEVRMISKMFNPNESDTARRYRTLYHNNSIERAAANPRALYRAVDVEGTEVLEVIPEKLKAIESAWNRVESTTKGMQANEAVPAEAVDALAEYLWNLGMQYGPTLETTTANLKTYFEQGTVVGQTELRDMALFNHFARNPKKPLVKLLEVASKETRNNIYTEEGSTINRIASIAPLFDGKAFGSFISGTGKQFYPINLPTTLDDLIMDLKSPQERAILLGEMLEDPLYNPGVNIRHQSPLITLLNNNPKLQEAFGIAKYDSFKEANNNISDYAEQSPRTSFVVRLNAFANNGNKDFTRIAIPTQADRGTLDFMVHPRYDKLSKLGFTKDEILRGIILQDIRKIAQAESQIAAAQKANDSSKLIEGYHYIDPSNPFARDGSVFTMTQIKGLEDTVLNPEEKIQFKLSDVITEYLSENPEAPMAKYFPAINAILNEKVGEVKEDLKKWETNIQDLIRKYDINLVQEVHSDMSRRADFIESFVFNEFVGRIEAAKLLRGGFSFAKNTADFYKRMALLSTPGQRLMIVGDSTRDPNYGMMETYTAITIADFKFIDPARAAIVAQTMMNNGLDENQALKYTNANLDLNKTDAQSFISMDMYRGIMMGIGAWDMVLDEQAFNREKRGEGYIDDNGNPRPIYPVKPYHEELGLRDGAMTLTMDKNSYMVVTNDLANQFPEFKKMHDVMKGGKVHVVNTRSATKGARVGVQDLQNQESLDPSTAVSMNSKKLRLPQLMSQKKDDRITFSRQLRKNIISNIVPVAIYDLPGLGDVTGADLFETYSDIIAENIKEDTENLQNELGITRLNKAKIGTQEYGDAKLAYLQNIQARLLEQVKDKELPANYDKALKIVPNGKNDWRFKVPLAFPNYQAKFEQIFLSIIKNDIFTQTIKGKELVQIAEAGGHGIAGELRMYDGINRAEVRIKASLLGLPSNITIEEVLTLDDPSILEAIGYRIPNQGKNSMLPIKVVGFLPESHEKAIMVPGGVTVQMGSDFDIDKMFIIQPETRIVKGRSMRVTPNYDINASRQEREAALYNIMDSILMSKNHIQEVLSPLDSTTLKDLAAERSTSTADVNYNHPLAELEMEERNKLGKRLIGFWANQLSGHNVAGSAVMLSKPMTIQPDYAPMIDYGDGDITTFSVVGQTISKNGEYTDQNINLYLSAAVDAGKGAIQVDINDNAYTVPVAGMMLTTGIPVEDVVYLLTQPAIKEAIEHARINDFGAGQLISSIDATIKKWGGKVRPGTNPVIVASDLRDPASADINNKQLDYLHNFRQFYLAGRQLQTVHKLITPDNLDNVNELSAIISHLEREQQYMRDPESAIIQGAESFITANRDGGRDVYPIAGAYRGILQTALNASEQVGFINNRPSFHVFKELLKDELGKYSFTPAQHKFVDRTLFLKLLAHENSPLANYFSQAAFEKLYLNKDNNIATRLERLKAKYPNLSSNAFVAALQADPANNKANAEVFGIKFDNSFDLSAHDKNRYSNGLLQLLTKPELFANDKTNKEEIKELKEFGRALVANHLLTKGFAPGSGTYIDLIPPEAFTTTLLIDDKASLTPVEFFTNISESTRLKDHFSNQNFMHEFVRNFGLSKPGGASLLKKLRYKGLPGTAKPKPGAPELMQFPREDARVYDNNLGYVGYFVTYHPTEGPAVYVREDQNTYKRLQMLGVNGKVHEVFSNRKIAESSIPNRPGTTSSPGRNFVEKRNADTVVVPESVEQPLKLCKA